MEMNRLSLAPLGLGFSMLWLGALLLAGENTLRVGIALEQQAPALPVVVADKNTDFCGETLEDPVLRMEDGQVLEAVVWVEWEGDPPAPQPSGLSLKSHRCLLVPRVQSAQSGSTLTLNSGDGITHNPHGWWNDRRTVFNLTLISPGMSFKRRLRHSGRYRIDCDTHRWMRAYVHIFDHPYHAVSSSSGAVIKGLPAGQYAVRVWHEILGEHSFQVDVEDGGETRLNVELPLRDHRKPERVPPLKEAWPPRFPPGASQP